MNILNYFGTSTKYGNTGQPKGGYLKLDYFQGALIHPDGVNIPKSYLSGKFIDLVGFLQAQQLKAPEKRVWCLPRFEGATDNTPAPEKKTTPYGFEKSQVEKPHSYDFEIEDFGTEYYKQLRLFMERSDMRIMPFQQNALMFELDEEGNAQGAEAKVYAQQAKVGNVADYAKQILTIEIKDKSFLTDNVQSVEIPKGKEFISYFKGILNVEHSEPSTNVVKAVTAITKTDLYDTYADELNVVGAWWIRNLLTGETTRPATIGKSATYKGWTITTAVSAPREIYLDTPEALAVLGVGSATSGGFESIPLTLGE